MGALDLTPAGVVSTENEALRTAQEALSLHLLMSGSSTDIEHADGLAHTSAASALGDVALEGV